MHIRVLETETVVHILNKNKSTIELNLKRFEEIGLNGKKLNNIINGNTIEWNDKLILNERGSTILTTKNNTQ